MITPSQMIHPRFLRRRAFSVLEVMIALAVLAVLALLLMAIGKDVMDRSKTAKCMVNLRSIHLGLANYINDVGHYPGYRVNTRPTFWYQALVPYMEGGPVPPSGPPYSAWLYCPARGGTSPGYGYNAYFGHVPPGSSDFSPDFAPYWKLRRSQVQQPSTKIVLGDNKDLGTTGSYSINQISRHIDPNNINHPRRHQKGGDFLFADGHVECLTPKLLTDRSKATGGAIFRPF